MKKIALLLSLFLFSSIGFGQTQKPANLADQTKVFPVPAKSTEQVTVSFTQPVTVNSVQLVRTDGWTPGGWLTPPQSQQQLTLQLPKLSSGTYLLKFSISDGRFFSKKIVIGR